MKDTLNFVFDDWEINKDSPNNNSAKDFGDHFLFYNFDEVIDQFEFKNYKKYRIDEIKNNENVNFYYLINSNCSFDYFLSKGIISINNNILNLIREFDNLFLIMINEQESEGILTLNKLHNISKKLKLNQKKIIFINNNSKLLEEKNILNTDIIVHTSKALSLLLKTINKINNNKINQIKIKKDPFLFLCQNHTNREHRIALLILLKKYDILKDVDWSLIESLYDNYPLEIVIEHLKNERILYKNEITFISNLKTKKCINENDIEIINDNYIDWKKNFFNEVYENTYFNIVTETFFLERHIHITEKSFKPFCYFQFPLIISSHHHIKYMKLNYDFDFFDDVIDHSYDNIIDNSDRLFKFVEEIKRIQENKDFFIKFYEENQDRFLENHKKYMNLDNQHDIDFFNSLI